MSKIAKNLKAKLIEKNISAHALEKLAGLKSSVVHNILQGKSKNPTAQTLQAISKVLDCPIDEILGNEPAKPSVSWNGALYLEAVKTSVTLFAKFSLDPNKEQALLFIEEIYLYALKGATEHIDQRFAEWLLSKTWPVNIG